MCGVPQMSNQTLNTVGLATSVGSMLFGAQGAYNKSVATQQSYADQAAVEDNKAAVADIQARDAVTAGQQKSFQSGLQYGALEGDQRAALAARGINLNTGSALGTLLDTKYMSGMDQATIADNANKEAWALHASANTDRMNAQVYRNAGSAVSPLENTATSLLSSALPVAQSWYKWADAGKNTKPAMPTSYADW